jgi:hypothetical protein
MRMMALGLLVALLPGCALFLAGAGAAGAYAYVNGELRREYDAPLDPTWTATVQALKALQIQVDETQLSPSGATVAARRGDGTSVQVALEPTASDRTLARIRIGVFGDRDRSARIAEEIQKQL